ANARDKGQEASNREISISQCAQIDHWARKGEERVFGAQTGQHRCALVEDRFGMFGGRADIAIVEAHQHLSGINSLIIGDQNLRDEPGNVRGDRSDVPAHIGVVGGLDEATGCPPIIAVAVRRQPANAGQRNQGELLEGQSRLRLGRRDTPFCQRVHGEAHTGVYAPILRRRPEYSRWIYRFSTCAGGVNWLAVTARSNVRNSAARLLPKPASKRACAFAHALNPAWSRFSPTLVK